LQISLSIRRFFERQALAPFETMLGFFFVYAAIASIAHFGVIVSPLTKLLGPTVATIFNLVYLLAGLAMYLGIGFRRGNIEAAGLILLMASLAIRTIATGWLLGTSPMVINGYVLNAAFFFSCAIRLRTIHKAQQLLERAQ
jgi:hypothetical protein